MPDSSHNSPAAGGHDGPVGRPPRPTPRPAPLPESAPRHARTAPAAGDTAQFPVQRPPAAPAYSPADAPSLLQQRLQGAFLTIIGLAGVFGGVLFSIEAPRFTPVPVVFLTFWLVMVIVGKILFTGLNKLRDAGVGAPAPQQLRAAAAVAGIIVAVGMMGFAATSAGSGVAAAAPCPGGGPATCGPDPGAPTLTFTPPPAQTNAPGGQQGQQGGQDQQGIATSPAQGGDNGPGIQAQTPQFGTPGQQAPNIPGNEQPGQGGQQPAQGQQTGQQNPVRTTAPGRPDQNQQQTDGQQTQPGQPSQSTVTVTQTQSQCPAPGAAGGNGGAPGSNGGPGTPGSEGGSNGGPDTGSSEEEGAPSWSYLVAEVTALMTGRRGRKDGPLNADGSTPTNDMIPGDFVEGEDYKIWSDPESGRTYILSENSDAPSQYRFNLNQPEGGSSKLNPDGSASVFDRDGNEVNRVKPPWAYDSVTGEKIPTDYTIDGNDLIQNIHRPEGNDNPILADPVWFIPLAAVAVRAAAPAVGRAVASRVGSKAATNAASKAAPKPAPPAAAAPKPAPAAPPAAAAAPKPVTPTVTPKPVASTPKPVTSTPKPAATTPKPTTASPATNAASSAARQQTANSRALGAAGEKAAGIAKNTKSIPAQSGKANYRIPDELLQNTLLGEVKNVSRLGLSPQMRDFIYFAANNPSIRMFNLYVRQGGGTRISKPLSDALDDLDKVSGVIVNILRIL